MVQWCKGLSCFVLRNCLPVQMWSDHLDKSQVAALSILPFLILLVSGFYKHVDIGTNSCHSAKMHTCFLNHVVWMVLPKLNTSQKVSREVHSLLFFLWNLQILNSSWLYTLPFPFILGKGWERIDDKATFSLRMSLQREALGIKTHTICGLCVLRKG